MPPGMIYKNLVKNILKKTNQPVFFRMNRIYFMFMPKSLIFRNPDKFFFDKLYF